LHQILISNCTKYKFGAIRKVLKPNLLGISTTSKQPQKSFYFFLVADSFHNSIIPRFFLHCNYVSEIRPFIFKSRRTSEENSRAEPPVEVCKTIKGVSVLDHISLELEGGNVYGVQGKNGCGKIINIRLA